MQKVLYVHVAVAYAESIVALLPHLGLRPCCDYTYIAKCV